MQLSMQEIADERLPMPFAAPDPFQVAIYDLYRLPLGTPVNRVVVISEQATPNGFFDDAEALEPEDASELLWQLLHKDGTRVGDVVYDQIPEPGDFILRRCPQGFIVECSMPLEAGVGQA